MAYNGSSAAHAKQFAAVIVVNGVAITMLFTVDDKFTERDPVRFNRRSAAGCEFILKLF